MDQGTTNKANNTWYERGYDIAAPTTGLPNSNSTFVGQNDPSHVYQMQSYTGNNALLISNSAQGGSTTGTLNFATPAAYRSLSLLASASSGGQQSIGLVVNYVDGTTATLAPIATTDWFTSTTPNTPAIGVNANGRLQIGTGSTTSTITSRTCTRPTSRSPRRRRPSRA